LVDCLSLSLDPDELVKAVASLLTSTGDISHAAVGEVMSPTIVVLTWSAWRATSSV
jgi:hypothetical protein